MSVATYTEPCRPTPTTRSSRHAPSSSRGPGSDEISSVPSFPQKRDESSKQALQVGHSFIGGKWQVASGPGSAGHWPLERNVSVLARRRRLALRVEHLERVDE